MKQHELSRRTVLKAGAGAGLVGMTMTTVSGPAEAFAADSGAPEIVLPWTDQPDHIPPGALDVLGNPLIWESLDSWHTPNAEFFTVKHYKQPNIAPDAFLLTVDGLVDHPQTLRLADLKAMRRQVVDFTLECSGNNGLPFLIGGIGNARWAGASLAQLLRSARPQARGVEVVFWGTDRGPVVIRDDSGIGEIPPGSSSTGTTTPDGSGGFDLTITEQFARSMTLEDAMNPDNMLCYEMNGQPLPAEHGAPLRLIAPGWYGVANVKWLSRIEIRDGRYAGRFMARDYVTIREEVHGGTTNWTFTNVSHDRLKSAPAKVTRRGDHYSVLGAAWGSSIGKVEVQVDAGPWVRARLRRTRATGGRGFSWSFWHFDWGKPVPGSHTIRSRAFDEHGTVQPTPEDPSLASRHTYWENNGQITRTVLIPDR